MPFEKLEIRTSPNHERSPAAITLYKTAKSDKPARVAISLRADIVAGAGFTEASTFDAYLGTGEEAGTLRLVAAKAGKARAVFMKRTNAFFVRLGTIEAIGTAPRPRTPTQAHVVVKGTVDIEIPPLAPAVHDGTTDKAAARGPAPDGTTGEIFLNGITIDLTADDASVTFDGEAVAVSPIEANLVKLLARPRPAAVSESFLIANLWGNHAPKNPAEALRLICAGDLKKMLSGIGLVLAPVKGVGYQLKDA